MVREVAKGFIFAVLLIGLFALLAALLYIFEESSSQESLARRGTLKGTG
jgi:hypothetical protein